MMRMMTMSAVAGALLLGLASTAFAATGEARHPRAEYQDCQASSARGRSRTGPETRTDCTIDGSFLRWPYCFGGDRVEVGSAY